MSDQRILRYQVVLMENPGLIISPYEVLHSATCLLIPEGSLPFHSCLEALDHWTKPQEGLSKDPLTNLEEILYTDGSIFVLEGKIWAMHAVVSNIETIEAKLLPPVTSPVVWAHSPDSSFRAGKRKNSSHLYLFQVCLSGATYTCCYLERKRPLDCPRVPNQVWWSNH